MRRDEFIKPLTYLSVITLLGVKALTAIIFVFVVLVAGLNYQKKLTATQPVATPIVATTPLPDMVFGPQEIFPPTPTPTMLVPTLTQTATLFPTFTETSLPTSTNLPTNTLVPTVTNIPTGTATATNFPTQTATVTVTNTPTSTATLIVLPTLKSTATLLPTLTPTVAPITTSSADIQDYLVASPLQGIGPNELASIITQPFDLPPAGEDSGHHGVDFAFWRRGDLTSIEGVPILSVFPGKVVSAYSKIRLPYGYMVMVETPLANLPKEILDAIKLPTASQTPTNPSNRLTCPTGFADWWSTDSKSLYVLYGHMKDVPSVKLGQTVKMGDQLGNVGNTGSSSNPHLHFEMRIGPSNATFASMGHYDTTATDQERHNYCMWRISGQFEMFDPMELYPTVAK
jgi:murein DD-endopeptidase MepM/ murein hydrolase activator NlpD